MAYQQNDEEEITGINVTPLVDVMLVLLIVFMATTTYMVQQSIQVNLPEADSGKKVGVQKNLSFTMDKESNLYVEGKPIKFGEIKDFLENEKKKAEQKNLQVLISADKNTPHGSVIKLIDEVQKNGIKDFALHVESKAASTH